MLDPENENDGDEAFEDLSDGEDLEEENGGGLRDMATERAKKTVNSNKSAIKVFNRFCTFQRRTIVRHPLILEDMTIEFCTQEMLGRFATFIFKVEKVKAIGTAQSYMGKIKTLLHERFPTSGLATNEKWYTGLRGRLFRRFQEKHKKVI